jgi:hypothetical protein
MANKTKSEAYNLYRSIRGKASTLWQSGGKYRMSASDMLKIEAICEKYMKKYGME